MIIKAIRQYRSVFSRTLSLISYSKQPKYSPPASQYDIFKELLQKIDKAQSRRQAAKLLARLESDEELYKEMLLQLDSKFGVEAQQNKAVLDVFDSTTRLQDEIDNQIEENNQIENRFFKAVDHNKIYGIARIAKEIIETADHIKQALKTIEESSAENKISQLSELTRIQAELVKVFGKYDIREFNPVDQLFNPNEHESIGFIETEEVEKKNRIVEVKRAGFKLKSMLLRPAFVVIYK